MEELIEVELSNGTKFKLGALTALDSIRVEETANAPVTELISKNPCRFGLLMAWRAAVAGGFDDPFEKFAEQVPLRDVPKLTEAVTQLMGNDVSEEKASSD